MRFEVGDVRSNSQACGTTTSWREVHQGPGFSAEKKSVWKVVDDVKIWLDDNKNTHHIYMIYAYIICIYYTMLYRCIYKLRTMRFSFWIFFSASYGGEELCQDRKHINLSIVCRAPGSSVFIYTKIKVSTKLLIQICVEDMRYFISVCQQFPQLTSPLAVIGKIQVENSLADLRELECLGGINTDRERGGEDMHRLIPKIHQAPWGSFTSGLRCYHTPRWVW